MQICVTCNEVVDNIDKKHNLWFYRRPRVGVVQQGITTRLAFHFLDRMVTWGTTFSQLMDALFVNGLQPKQPTVDENGVREYHLAGVKFPYNLELFQQVISALSVSFTRWFDCAGALEHHVLPVVFIER